MKQFMVIFLALFVPALAQAQSFPSPTYKNLTVTTNTTLEGPSTALTSPTLTNTTNIATTAFTGSSIIRAEATSPITITGGTYNYATLGSGLQVVVFSSGGVVSSILTISSGGTGYAIGDVLYLSQGNDDAVVRVTNVSGGVVQSGGISILYGGTGYGTGLQVTAIQPPIDARNTITLTGTLTSNAQFIAQQGTFLTSSHQLIVNNNTMGAFTVNFCQTNGSDACNGGPTVTIPQGSSNSCATLIQKDGETGIWFAATPVCQTATAGANSNITSLSGVMTYNLTHLLSNTTAPTILSGFGTTPSITNANGTAAFGVVIGSGGTTNTGTLTMPAAFSGWVCDAQDITTQTASVSSTKETGTTTTSVTFTQFNDTMNVTPWVAGDTLLVKCTAH
jgi:hypothetical protein